MKKGILYLVPSPIGNLNEVSPRIISILNLVDLVACEDTRNTGKLLHLLNIEKPLFSCHEHNEKEASQTLIKKLLNGEKIAYLSDAGYPCISDPGALLVKEAINYDITITPLSGPNAFLNALVGSGLDASHFLFYGFLNAKKSQREDELQKLKDLPYTLIFYEAPHRVNETLLSLYQILGNRKISIARELTKIHEEFIRGDLKSLITSNREFIGELVLVVEKKKEEEKSIDLSKYLELIDELINKGLKSKDAIVFISTNFKINKNDLYKAYLDHSKK